MIRNRGPYWEFQIVGLVHKEPTIKGVVLYKKWFIIKQLHAVA